MIGILAWSLILAAEPAAPAYHVPIPPTLEALFERDGDAPAHHQSYLKELARRPDLAASETGWWQSVNQPALQGLALRFNESLAQSEGGTPRFDAFYDQLLENPELRDAVEGLLRTELETTRDDPGLASAVRYLRANPDLAMRFLENPARVRPLPDALADSYDAFLARPQWRASLRGALGEVLEQPAAHQAVLPWWEQLTRLEAARDEADAALDTELHGHPRAFWLWHLRNVNRARQKEARPWIRYWERLIHREPDLARQYGPFVTDLLRDPERLRQHLADLEGQLGRSGAAWPPEKAPPRLPPMDISGTVDALKGGINQPRVNVPERPTISRPPRPRRPQRPSFPDFPSPRDSVKSGEQRGPVFPTFPKMPEPTVSRPKKDRGD